MDETIKTPPPAPVADSAADGLAGTTVGRFSISERLGAGGMGQVYGAEDTTLKRRVAIKRMAPQASSTEADRKRLLKEAQRASALNHPNIGAIYDVVEHAGELWLVMEYVEGETLRHRLARPIPPGEFFSIATQCCEGLQAAHEKGIIHGDIKPENIMLAPGGRVKILDFGVARRAWSSQPGDATKTMETMTASGGTPAYMAPEVLLQQHDDGRSDLFSLGLVCYEMLGGEQPFRSESLATTVAKIVHHNPAPLKNVPGPLATVVYRALAKNPDLRYPSAAALLEDLRRVEQGGKPKGAASPTGQFHQYRMLVTVGVALVVLAALLTFRPVRRLFRIGAGAGALAEQSDGLPPTKILAVLPFTAANGDPKLTALGQGLVESVAAKLGRLSEDRAFEVVPEHNLQERKISTLPDVAHMFGANLGLALALEPADNLVKVTYSLLGAQSDKPLATGSVAVPPTDSFTAEQLIVNGAVKALRLQLLPEEEAALKFHGTDNPAAYDFYLQAQGYLLTISKAENLDNAALMAREALKLDPNFGMAKAVLGQSYWFKYSLTKQKQWIAPAQSGCNEAIHLGNAGAAGHVCLGLIDEGTGDYAKAAAEYQLALGLEPGDEEAAIHLGRAYEQEGKIAEAEQAFQQAIQAHPSSRFSYNAFGQFYIRRYQYDNALAMFHKVIEIAPDWYGTYVNIGNIYTNLGDSEKAIDFYKKSIAIRPSYQAYDSLGAAYYGLNKFDEAASALKEATRLDPRQYVTWGDLGTTLYYGGRKEQSVEPFRKAAELASQELEVNPHDPVVLSNLAGFYAMLNDQKQALVYLGKSLQYGRKDKEVLIDAAAVYNRLGNSSLAMEWLVKAVQAGYAADKIRKDPEFANLVNSPAYEQLMKASSR
jgi:serine/threonine-protein kinase